MMQGQEQRKHLGKNDKGDVHLLRGGAGSGLQHGDVWSRPSHNEKEEGTPKEERRQCREEKHTTHTGTTGEQQTEETELVSG
eukprot:10182418-Prorocentrum_lima.AAC.1